MFYGNRRLETRVLLVLRLALIKDIWARFLAALFMRKRLIMICKFLHALSFVNVLSICDSIVLYMSILSI